MLASQALLHVLSAERYQTVVDEVRDLPRRTVRHASERDLACGRRAVELVSDGASARADIDLDELRKRYRGVAASEEELLLVALFGEDAEPLLQTIRSRGRDDPVEAGGIDAPRAERIREIVRIVEESGVGEVTIEDAGLRVTVRRSGEPASGPCRSAAASVIEDETSAAGPAAEPPADPGVIRVEAPMVGTFYRAPVSGGPPFVQEGDPVGAGQTLCILEAMKLMNEVKAEQDGIVRGIHAENAEPVEYGQLLFELGRSTAGRRSSRCSRASWSRTAARSPSG